jgi:hypothetical protein
VAHIYIHTLNIHSFQEQYLPKCNLVFINQLAYFRCQRCIWSEDTSFDSMPKFERTEIDNGMASIYSGKRPLDIYHDFIMMYSKRQFTKESDYLNAFVGVANNLGTRMQCKFFQGLPVSCFDGCLIFFTLQGSIREYQAARRKWFPS